MSPSPEALPAHTPLLLRSALWRLALAALPATALLALWHWAVTV